MCWVVCMLRKDLRWPKFSLLADREAVQKQEVKAKVGLSFALLSIEAMPKRKPLGKDLETWVQGV